MKTMRLALLFGIALLVALAPLAQSGVIRSVTCVVNGVVGCNGPGLSIVAADAGSGITGENEISGGGLAQYQYNVPDLNAPPITVSVDLFASSMESYHTRGAARMGVAEILFIGTECCNTPPGQGDRSTDATVSESGMTLHVGCTAVDYGGCSNGVRPPGGGLDLADLPRAYPFELGVPFQVSTSAGISAFLFSGNQPSASVDVSGSLMIQLFEADGMTPVEIFPTPEPASFALVGLGLVVILALRERFKQVGRSRW